MIQAITNQQVGLNVITELIVGYALPGRPIAMMLFKTYGYITMAQALQFASDMKLGHYMKVRPRAMFFAQVWKSVLDLAYAYPCGTGHRVGRRGHDAARRPGVDVHQYSGHLHA
jgi:hypothetical protein